ncbi:hypothetical protein CY0110_17987 [Crocosphaera chwakensis CCY0110]|uniref:Uncharacterized protein n=1 Tax=Crocosphaera chwakensis CCY0110 TaxID=391612 RepID=A3IIS9_9CHRO|nr:hypothetical protein CY0110_17987 [Crocosphaera chwakensis CCY0110]
MSSRTHPTHGNTCVNGGTETSVKQVTG